MWVVLGVAEGEVVVRVVFGGEVAVVVGTEDCPGVVEVVPIIPPLPACAVVPVVDCVPMPAPAEPVLMPPGPAPVGMVVPGVPFVAVVGGEVIIVPPPPGAPGFIGPEFIRRDWLSTSRPPAAPGICATELEPGLGVEVPGPLAVVALPSATRGRLPASARVPNPDTAAQAAATAATTSRPATIVSIMCLDQFTAITSSKDTRSAVGGKDHPCPRQTHAATSPVPEAK